MIDTQTTYGMTKNCLIPEVACVYQLRFSATGDCYVGSCKNLRKRIAFHCSRIRRKIHTREIQPLADVYGLDGIQASILEQCGNHGARRFVEQKWIDAIRPSLNQNHANGLFDALDRAKAWIEDPKNIGCTLADAARVAGLSTFYFCRTFGQRFGKTPKRLMAEVQIAYAKTLMRHGVELAGVAAQSGFAHHSHFSMRFRQIEGITPTRWMTTAASR